MIRSRAGHVPLVVAVALAAFAAVLGSDRVLTVSATGKVVLWSVPDLRPAYVAAVPGPLASMACLGFAACGENGYEKD